jgi:hypothetical protein
MQMTTIAEREKAVYDAAFGAAFAANSMGSRAEALAEAAVRAFRTTKAYKQENNPHINYDSPQAEGLVLAQRVPVRELTPEEVNAALNIVGVSVKLYDVGVEVRASWGGQDILLGYAPAIK